jgi:hypothetical protein
MVRARRTPPAIAARDAALRRLSRVKRALAAGTLVLAVALTALAARGFSGHTSTAAAHVAGTSSTKTHAARRTTTRNPQAVRHDRSGHAQRSTKRLSRPSAPPATAQTTTTTAPAPTTAPTTTVSGGS